MGRAHGTLALLALLVMKAGALEPVADERRPDPRWGRQVIYEVNLRQFSAEGTLDAFRGHLPRLRELGVDILWLMPIFPVGLENRKGGLGSPYSVRDYRAVNPELGSLEDLRELTREAHALGMSVILDWVANHCAWDNPLVTQQPEWLTRGADGRPQPPVADWSDVVDLDYSQRGLRDYQIQSMAYWLRMADVDGFRCDVAGMVPTDFWQEVRPALEAVKPVFLLAEWEDPLLAGPFDMSYSWDLHRAGNAYMQDKLGVDQLDSLLRAEEGRWPAGHIRMRFTTNHDENSWNGTEDERLGPAADAFGVLAATLPGMPLLYNGQEAGLAHRLSFFEKDEIVWQAHPRQALYASLNRLKHLSPALWETDVNAASYRRLPTGSAPGSEKVWAFLRGSSQEDLLCVVNLGGEPITVELADPALSGAWRVWEDGALEHAAGTLQLELPAWGWRLLRHPR
ncbi:MAG: alpha-amylase family glycosyl hydrolase [Candidatus Delongbacteria bacterium]